METWSHPSVKEFEITFFVDTNILSYLVDETYPLLNEFIKRLKNYSIINLVSSEYALLEFIGIRKREHYLREAVSQTQKLGKVINLSSLLKYHNQFDLPEIDFYSLLPAIKANVDKEKERITSEFGITFSNGFHQGLLNPTSDICLSSKISKEDSLILMSSIIPNEREKNNNVILITNDHDFHKCFNDNKVANNIDDIFQNFVIQKPSLQHIEKIEGSNSRIFNLTENKDKIDDIIASLVVYLQENLKQKLEKFYLGKTFLARDNNFPNDCICFEAVTNKNILNNKYLTIIGKDLDFVYNIDYQCVFWSNGKAINEDTFTVTEGNNYLSFILNIEDNISEKAYIFSKLKEAGNLIFLHPNN